MTIAPTTLLVEDDDKLADTLCNAFREANVRVEHARDWQSGLELFRAGGHELVIADYNLPGSEHGLLLLLQVKVLMPSTRIVLISGALTPQAEAELEPLNIIDAYFSKDSILVSRLLPWVEEAHDRAAELTDWQRFADGHLSDPAVQRAEVARIDAILRASVEPDA